MGLCQELGNLDIFVCVQKCKWEVGGEGLEMDRLMATLYCHCRPMVTRYCHYRHRLGSELVIEPLELQ